MINILIFDDEETSGYEWIAAYEGSPYIKSIHWTDDTSVLFSDCKNYDLIVLDGDIRLPGCYPLHTVYDGIAEHLRDMYSGIMVFSSFCPSTGEKSGLFDKVLRKKGPPKGLVPFLRSLGFTIDARKKVITPPMITRKVTDKPIMKPHMYRMGSAKF